jgi:hypothetical protein
VAKRSAEFEEKKKKFGESTRIKLGPMKVFDHPGFRYTTPSAMKENLSAKEKRDIGCYEKPITKYCFKTDDGKAKCSKVKRDAQAEAGGRAIHTKIEKSFTGGRCPGKSNVCPENVQVYDERCKAKGKPCESDRATCPVQLVWVKGKPNLRFCLKQKEPGYLVPVKNVREAMQISDEACRKWPYQLGVQEQAEGSEEEGWDSKFFDKNAPNIPTLARQAYPGSGGLGRLPRPQQPPQRGNPIWLAIGLAMGLAGAALLKTGPATEAPST